MLIGYARVSKADGSQSLDLQQDALRAEGVEATNLYHDIASGVRDDRPGLDSCLRALRRGDVLVVWKLDRLGRNLAHLVNTVQDLSARGVGLRMPNAGCAATSTPRRPRSCFPGVFPGDRGSAGDFGLVVLGEDGVEPGADQAAERDLLLVGDRPQLVPNLRVDVDGDHHAGTDLVGLDRPPGAPPRGARQGLLKIRYGLRHLTPPAVVAARRGE